MNKKVLLCCLGSMLLLGLVIFGLELTNITHIFHKAKVPVTASTYTKGEPVTATQKTPPTPTSSSSSQNNSSSSDEAQPGDQKSTSTGSSATAAAPTGDFVSSHHVQLGSSLVSVCNTTPGATCTIQFSNGNTTKSLPVITTDRGGSAYWNNWTPSSIGLTPGTWDVKAMATLNGQSASASDAMKMEIAQ